MPSTAKRHWVATLLAGWMFADALLALLWEATQLYSVWGFKPDHDFQRRTHHLVAQPSLWYLWRIGIIEYFSGLLQLLPAPHLLLGLREAVVYGLLHSRRTSSLLRDSALNITVFVIAVVLGYGLLKTREWARWSYAVVCVATLLLAILWGLPLAFTHPVAIYRMISFLISPIALLVFLFRRGLVVQTPEMPVNPARTPAP